MYAHIVPLSNSFDTKALTYSVGDFEKEIKIGCLVQIPLGKKEDLGLIVGLETSLENRLEDADIKPILSLESTSVLLADYQIQLVRMIATKYLLPIHKVLQIFLSRPLIRRLQKHDFPLEKRAQSHKKQKNTFEGNIIKESIVEKKHIEPSLKDGNVIIVPDDIFLFGLQKSLENRDDIAYFFDDMTDTKKAQFWIDTVNKKNKIIIGTRKILYYNLSSYKKLVYIEDAFADSYFHYPIHIQHLDILAYISSYARFDISILTSLPKLTTLHNFRHFTWKNI